MMKDKSFISVILKFENFDSEIIPALHELQSFLNITFIYSEMIVIVNSSSDETYFSFKNAIDTLSDSHVHLIQIAHHVQSDAAMLPGIHKAMGDFIFQIPYPNFDFRFSLLEEMLTYLRTSSYDVLAAVPKGNIPWSSQVFYKIFNRLSLLDDTLSTERVLLTSRRAINAASRIRQNLKYFKVLLMKAGFKRNLMTYLPTQKLADKKESSFQERLTIAFDLLLNYSAFGSRLGFLLSGLFFLWSVSVSIYAIYSYLHYKVISGWTSMMSFVAISFAGLFFLLGLVISSLRKVLEVIQDNTTYQIKQTYSRKP